MFEPKKWGYGALVLIPLWLFANYFETTNVEADLTSRASAAIPPQTLDKPQIAVAGRDVMLDGKAFDAASRDAAEVAIATLPGVRLVNSGVATFPAAKPYNFTATLADKKLTLSGNVPSPQMRANLLEAAKSANPDATILDNMTYAAGSPAGLAAAGGFAIAEVSKLRDGQASISDEAFSLSGETEKTATAQEIKATLAADLPGGLKLKDQNIKDLEASVLAKNAEKLALAEKAASVVADKLAADKLAADKLAADKLAADKAVAEKAEADKLAADKASADKALADKTAADKSATNKAAADQAASDQAASDQAAANQAAANKLMTDKAAAAVQVVTPAHVLAACEADVGSLLQADKVHFAVARAVILPQSNSLLDKIASELGKCATAHVQITGFTDSDGDS